MGHTFKDSGRHRDDDRRRERDRQGRQEESALDTAAAEAARGRGQRDARKDWNQRTSTSRFA